MRTSTATAGSARPVLAAVVLGVLAAALRLGLVLHGGGLVGVGNYDDGVYFGAADALVHGRLPYRDFLFLQPPGILVVLAPFAALGGVLGDAHALALARLVGYLFAGVTTALVVLALRRAGTIAAGLAGLLYALIEPSVFTSRSTLLEPVGALCTALVLAVLGGAPPRRPATERTVMAFCGALLGLAVTVKIWAVVPGAIFFVAARRRRPLWLLGGAVVATVAITAPFLVAGPSAVWRQVVLDQLGRPRFLSAPLTRLGFIVQSPDLPDPARGTVTEIVLAVVAVCAVLSWRVPIARLCTVQLLATIALLLATPSFFDHYAALATPFLAVVVGAGLARAVALLPAVRIRRVAGTLTALAVVAYCLIGWAGTDVGIMLHPPVGVALVQRVHGQRGCIVSDDPTLLILTDTLTRDLTHGCPFWPDLTGWELDADRVPPGTSTSPLVNAAFQGRMVRYLDSGSTAIIGRARHRLTAATLAALGPTERVSRGRYLVTTTPPHSDRRS